MSKATLKSAGARWLELVDSPDLAAAQSDRLEQAERLVLSLPITSDAEAVILAEVLIENIRAGQRPDGLDATAACRLQAWVARPLGAPVTGRRGYAALALGD